MVRAGAIRSERYISYGLFSLFRGVCTLGIAVSEKTAPDKRDTHNNKSENDVSDYIHKINGNDHNQTLDYQLAIYQSVTTLYQLCH